MEKTQDLGPVNGQEPIKELNRLLYWTITLILLHYHQTLLNQAASQKVSTLDSKNIKSYLEEVGQCFIHLPLRQRKKMQYLACEKLAQVPGFFKAAKQEYRTSVYEAAYQYKREYAACTLQKFYRQHLVKKQMENDTHIDKKSKILQDLGMNGPPATCLRDPISK